MLFWIQSLIYILLISILGARISKEINVGNIPWYSSILTSILSGLVWGWMVSKSKSIIYTSLFYDVVVTVTYIGVLTFLGEQLKPIQIIGIIFGLIGIILLGLK
jgi:drug/metabolite transporter (DMT)-like permease